MALEHPEIEMVMFSINPAFDMMPPSENIDEAVAYETASPQERDCAALLAGAPMHAYYGNCIYCGHCQPCTVGINIAEVNKLAELALMQDEVPQSVREHYLALDATASDCIACGTCEPNCPFGVHIIERMEETAELFGE